MYYPDGTRYDQVDGISPVVPFTRTPRGTGSTPSSRSPADQVGRGQSRLPGCSGERDDGTRYMVPLNQPRHGRGWLPGPVDFLRTGYGTDPVPFISLETRYQVPSTRYQIWWLRKVPNRPHCCCHHSFPPWRFLNITIFKIGQPHQPLTSYLKIYDKNYHCKQSF